MTHNHSISTKSLSFTPKTAFRWNHQTRNRKRHREIDICNACECWAGNAARSSFQRITITSMNYTYIFDLQRILIILIEQSNSIVRRYSDHMDYIKPRSTKDCYWRRPVVGRECSRWERHRWHRRRRRWWRNRRSFLASLNCAYITTPTLIFRYKYRLVINYQEGNRNYSVLRSPTYMQSKFFIIIETNRSNWTFEYVLYFIKLYAWCIFGEEINFLLLFHMQNVTEIILYKKETRPKQKKNRIRKKEYYSSVS